MVDRDIHNSDSRNPTVQRSKSIGARLHFSYTGKKTEIRGSSSSRPKLSDTVGGSTTVGNSIVGSNRLLRQSTFDYSHLTSTPSTLSPPIPRRSTQVYNEPVVIPKVESASLFPRTTNSRVSQEVPYFYAEASSAPMSSSSHLAAKNITQATSPTLLPSPPPPRAQNLGDAPPPVAQTTQYNRNYGNNSYSAYSSYDPSKRVTPADTSPRIQDPRPPDIPRHHSLAPVDLNQSPSPIRRTQKEVYPHSRRQTSTNFPTAPETTHLPVHSLAPVETARRSPSPVRRARIELDPRSRRQTTTAFPTTAETTYLPVREYSRLPNPLLSVAREPTPTSAPKPLSLNSQNPRLRSQDRRHMTIGYTQNQYQVIQRAREEIRAETERQENEIKAKLQAERRAEDQKRFEERRRIREASELEARKRVEESARLEAERLALEAVMRAAQPPDEDADVEKFIQNLNQRIQDSRDSKNLQGALVGRHQIPNPATNAENLTNALNEEEEKAVEGHNDQVGMSTQNAATADSSEVRTFLDRLKEMKIDKNQNRKKFAEKFYDPEDDDSELNSVTSMSSFLSTVPEEDPDTTSLDNQFYLIADSQPNHTPTLQPRVISYIHDMVDGILSCLNKADFENVIIDTQKTSSQLYDEDLYADATNYNHRAISETARQFFTPQSSPVDETNTNDFYNDSL
ncbi:hypothetical protein L3Y34_010975 [Caenorhabditis briggsae]|uniref:Uncharacterized protein n=1 Tax=Caenorhabditis briggsae TaxID=6238 RepID=A0AAE8ZP01_CAEBR|nr:hypothetical protein L3Y34_010975 [Caenorhabditis briggsae]